MHEAKSLLWYACLAAVGLRPRGIGFEKWVQTELRGVRIRPASIRSHMLEFRRLGYLERYEDPKDRRTKIYRFTKKGERELREGLAQVSCVASMLARASAGPLSDD